MHYLNSPTNVRAVSTADLERLYEQVQLIGGKGSRRDARLCIMTFVALLAGERHTDAPAAASPLIREFAITLNDGMPDDERQRLKPFAPSIVGTKDARDPERAELLRAALVAEIGPQLRRDGIDLGRPSVTVELSVYAAHYTGESQCLRGGYLDDLRNDRRFGGQRVGTEVAKLLVRCATEAAPSASRPWYWTKGIDLLDRLCDVGHPGGSVAVSVAQLVRAQEALCSGRFDGISQRMALLISDLKDRLRSGPLKPGGGSDKPESALQTRLYLH